MKISIIIPIYNEWSTIHELFEKLLALDLDKEIIAVDDGSDDGTSEILASIIHPKVKVIRHAQNSGKGAAIRTGIKYCKGDIILLQDADMEQVPEEIHKLIEPILKGKAAVVYGSRLIGPRPEMTLKAYIANIFLSWLTRVIYASTITDLETAYKAFKREVIQAFPIASNGFEFEPEITAKILRLGIPIFEIPVKMDWFRGYHNNTKKIRWTDGLIAVWTLLRLAFWKPTPEVAKQGELIRAALLSRRADSPTHSSANHIS